ncbi:hypothetical protein EXS54_02745 [Patescibacteria group bacterium]|nr:hypothetical protein [Patescibacteria group bacterium]
MADAPASSSASGGLAVKRSIPRVIIFGILSPLYSLYWFYQTRGVVSKQVGGQDQVGLQTVGLIVPILNLFIWYWLLRDVDKFNKGAGGQGFPVSPIWMILGPIILGIIPFVNFLAPFVAIAVIIIVLLRLNEALDKKGATDAPYTGGEIAVVVLGALFWVFYFVVIAAVIASIGTHSAVDVNTSTYSY